MKKLIIILLSVVMVVASCNQEIFEEYYPDPSKISASTVEKQFTGMMNVNLNYVLPDYWNYFVILRTTANRWTQSVGWVNDAQQYVPGGAAITDRWNNYYNFLSQYRVLQKIYNSLSDREKADKKIYMIAATIYFYHHTQYAVDLYGDIPWTEAGQMSSTGGDYVKSRAKYDNAQDIYTKMLDDLKSFSDELNTITVIPGVLTGFRTQDIVNKGDLDKWKRYNNSLRLRMLARVSGVPAFQARVTAETLQILGNPASFPVLENNNQNIQINVYSQDTPIHSRNFQTGLEDWNGNLASKGMLDHLVANADPRLRVLFQPAQVAGAFIDEWIGIDPLMLQADQEALITAGRVSRYNWSTLSRNHFFPGLLMNAAEVDFIKAEALLLAGQDGPAKAAYEKGIANSVDQFYRFRAVSNNSASPAYAPYTAQEIMDYVAKDAVSWDKATTAQQKLKLIATQKWIHFNVVQSLDNWAEQRRLRLPELSFWVDSGDPQNQPPRRFRYPDSEKTYNEENYNVVKAKDTANTKIFWDVK
jgi:tetratricopeptide (TPR) repeat protein